MTTVVEELNNEDDTNWLMTDKYIETIEYYEYSDFKNIQKIGKGAFGMVVRANWKSTDGCFALKSFNNDKITHKEVEKEVNLLFKVHNKKMHLHFIFATVTTTSEHCSRKYYTVIWNHKGNW